MNATVMSLPSIFDAIARLRWPQANPVFGSGAFAVVSRCPANPFVRLFENEQEARSAVNAECGHAFCVGAHRHQFVNLTEPQAQRAPVVYRKKPRWAKMLNDA